MQNFLDCVRSREKPTLDVDTAMRAQVTITMSVMSYREGRVLYWDEKAMKVVGKAPKAYSLRAFPREQKASTEFATRHALFRWPGRFHDGLS